MWNQLFRFLLPLCLYHCSADVPATQVISKDPNSFTLNILDDEAGRALFANGNIHGDRCEAVLARVAGRDAIKLSTLSEFSDIFIDVEKLFGHPINFREASYFYFDAYVPEGSWIASIKFNHKGTEGNFGGCGNSANNLADHQGKWFTVEVPIEDWLPLCKNWSGEGDVLASTSEFTINPYNANRVDTGIVYLNNLRLTKEKLDISTLNPRLIDKPYVEVNSPYTITWDDQNLLNKQLAWRSFEATTQHITANKFGNPTHAIRSYGTGQNKYICLLPDIEQMTGHPVNLHKLDSLHFRYYLTPESAPVGGATLFITSGDDWDAILVDTNFMSADDFHRGRWTYFSAAIKDLNLEQAREKTDVLAAVYEFRLDLHYETDAGPIEIWYDDFGWK